MTHTPGAWTAFYKNKYDEWHIALPMAGSSMKLALCPDGIQSENRKADAHLIAAAPELLAAAELAMEGIEVLGLLIASIEKHGNYSVESTLGFLNQARCARLRLTEAIAKAEGRS